MEDPEDVVGRRDASVQEIENSCQELWRLVLLPNWMLA